MTKVAYVGARDIDGVPFVDFKLVLGNGLGVDVRLPADAADRFAKQISDAVGRARELKENDL